MYHMCIYGDMMRMVFECAILLNLPKLYTKVDTHRHSITLHCITLQYTHTHIHIHIHIYMCIYMLLYVYMYVCLFCLSVCMYVCYSGMECTVRLLDTKCQLPALGTLNFLTSCYMHFSAVPSFWIVGYPSFLSHFSAGARAHGSPATEPMPLSFCLA